MFLRATTESVGQLGGALPVGLGDGVGGIAEGLGDCPCRRRPTQGNRDTPGHSEGFRHPKVGHPGWRWIPILIGAHIGSSPNRARISIDIVDYLEKYAGRYSSLHMHDYDPEKPGRREGQIRRCVGSLT